MNERIRELAEQCWIDDECGYGCGRTQEFDPEKFADLIIRECVMIINHGIDHTDYPNDHEKSMIELKAQRWCKDAIKEHFGVER